MIIVDEGASVDYVEGCTAPNYSSDSLHAAVVEVNVCKDAYCRYTTIQNWSDNVYSLETKRAAAAENATMEWVDGNLGSKVTMKYPSVYLNGEGARGTMLSIAVASNGIHQDSGARMIHNAKNTSSSIVSKSIAKTGAQLITAEQSALVSTLMALKPTLNVTRSLWTTNHPQIRFHIMKLTMPMSQWNMRLKYLRSLRNNSTTL